MAKTQGVVRGQKKTETQYIYDIGERLENKKKGVAAVCGRNSGGEGKGIEQVQREREKGTNSQLRGYSGNGDDEVGNHDEV